MAHNSKIEWCDHTVNLWWGCSKVHTGCKNCYAEVLSDTRYQKNLWGEKAGRQRIKSAFNDLDKYQKQAASENKLLKIFCGSMMDIFEKDKPLINPDKQFERISDMRQHLFQLIDSGKYNNLVFLFLTKRPENILNLVPLNWLDGNAPQNVWFGTSISNQLTANSMIPILLKTNMKNLFLSIEPQVDGISFRWALWHDFKSKSTAKIEVFEGGEKYTWNHMDGIKGIKWIIQGGESGSNKRPFDINWAYGMKDDCEAAYIPYFFKQIDKIQPIPNDLLIRQFPEFQSFDGKIKTEATWQAKSTL